MYYCSLQHLQNHFCCDIVISINVENNCSQQNCAVFDSSPAVVQQWILNASSSFLPDSQAFTVPLPTLALQTAGAVLAPPLPIPNLSNNSGRPGPRFTRPMIWMVPGSHLPQHQRYDLVPRMFAWPLLKLRGSSSLPTSQRCLRC